MAGSNVPVASDTVMIVWSAFTISGPILGCSSFGAFGSGVSTNATFMFVVTNVGMGFTVL